NHYFKVGILYKLEIDFVKFQLLIKERSEGSQIFTLEPQIQTAMFGASLIDDVVERFSEIPPLIDEDRDGDKYKELKGMIKNNIRRNRLFNNLNSISKYPSSFSIQLRKSRDEPVTTIFTPKKKYRKTISKWKELDVTKREEEFIGALTIVHGEGEIYFKIRDIHGASIKYKFPEVEEEKYINYYKKIIKVSGLYDPVRNKLENITNLELMEKISLDKLNDLVFKEDLKLDLEFKNDAFFVVNEDLNIVAAGKTFKEMYNNLYDCLTTHIDYFVFSKVPLTPGAQKIKQRLYNLINLDNWERISNDYV
ncbi:MAG: hypothetical protein ACFE8B_10935, partial [Candidatus Hermodarchaeota archaeon]